MTENIVRMDASRMAELIAKRDLSPSRSCRRTWIASKRSIRR